MTVLFVRRTSAFGHDRLGRTIGPILRLLFLRLDFLVGIGFGSPLFGCSLAKVDEGFQVRFLVASLQSIRAARATGTPRAGRLATLPIAGKRRTDATSADRTVGNFRRSRPTRLILSSTLRFRGSLLAAACTNPRFASLALRRILILDGLEEEVW